jgi:FkbM family methyltransferase
MSKIYFDIGSNSGKWAFANCNNADKIISVEASPTTFNILVENCLNGGPDIVYKVVPINKAVCVDSNGTGEIKFYDCINANTISTLNKDWLSSERSRFYNYCNFGYSEIVVKTVTIDELISTYGVPDLIKIDVECGEYECIKSLTRKTPCLCFEWASEMNDITYKCLDYLDSLGFNHFFLQFEDDYLFRPSNYVDSIDDIKFKLSKTTPKVEWGMIWAQ